MFDVFDDRTHYFSFFTKQRQPRATDSWARQAGTARRPIGGCTATGRLPHTGSVGGRRFRVALGRTAHSQGRHVIVSFACPNEVSAAFMASQLVDLGYARVSPLKNGIDGWVEAALPLVVDATGDTLPVGELVLG